MFGVLALGIVATAASAQAQINFPQPGGSNVVSVRAPFASRWLQGSREVWHLTGGCRVAQGDRVATAQEAIVWVERQGAPQGGIKITAYLEGNVAIQQVRAEGSQTPLSMMAALRGRDTSKPTDRATAKTWLTEFSTLGPPQIQVGRVVPESRIKPAIYDRGELRRRGDHRSVIRRTQFAPEEIPRGAAFPAEGKRRLRAFPRSSTPWNITADRNPATGEWVVVIDGGVTMIIDGVGDLGSIDVSTDRMVLWTTGQQMPDVAGGRLQDASQPLEIYMEGNVVFRQGERTIWADRIFYDVRNSQGLILNAEMLTPVPEIDGSLRIKSQVLRRLDENHFAGENALVTTSRFGVPGYWFQANSVTYEHIQVPGVAPGSGAPLIDPSTGEQLMEHKHWVTSNDNFLYLEGFPVFYWPTLATDASDPTFYIDRVRFANDNVFGTQIYTDWNAYELLGIRNPLEGTEWGASFDYLSDRGFGVGTNFEYDRNVLFGIESPYKGFADAWFMTKDRGFDDLGRDRRAVPPDQEFRGRVLWQHRHYLPNDFILTAEAGWISDRNFLQQYFENEWDDFKDQTTNVELKQLLDNQSWSIFASGRVNDFFTQTEWLPRFDHYLPGYSFWNDRFTLYEHFNVGYGRLKIVEDPPADQTLMPWEVPAEGERVALRSEVDMPLSVGPVKVVPYLLGEAAHWGENIFGDDMQRVVGQVGLRASMPMWAVDPTVESHLFNVHGLAHKVVFDMDFSFTDASQDVTDLPLYDPLDDDNIEEFRRRYLFDQFGPAPLPPAEAKVDERFYAIRNGLGNWVMSPSTEVIDDLTALRFNVRQRWQTKRGRPGARRIIDYMVLDTGAVLFPRPSENFDQAIGLISYDWRWHVGDRTTLVSDGLFDVFGDGQKVFRVGGYLNRPPKGSLYMGLRSLEGPVSSNVATGSFTYLLNEKWLTTFGSSFDLTGNDNIGQHLSITRIGESLLVTFGFNVDASKGNVGVSLSVVPRLLASSPNGPFDGAQIPPQEPF